jgi:16S rRNA processing protein RimM
VARIVGAHGLDGELRVRLHGADLACLASLRTLWLTGEHSGVNARPHALLHAARGRAGECRLRLEGIRDRADAENAAGLWLEARREDLPPSAPGEYYLYELVDCAVEDAAGRALGTVRGLWETGGADLLVIEAADGREHLVPLAASLLLQVDVAARRIVVDALPGLFDVDA